MQNNKEQNTNQLPQYTQPQINVHVNNVNTANAYSVPTYSTKSRWVAFFLCLFLGWIGIHRFYLGKTVTGIIFLLTGGLFCIGWIWDGIMLIMNNAKDGDGRPLR